MTWLPVEVTYVQGLGEGCVGRSCQHPVFKRYYEDNKVLPVPHPKALLSSY